MYYPGYFENEEDMETPIKKFVEVDGKWTTKITMGSYHDVSLRYFSWKYIPECTRMGWVQDNYPARPFIIASEGMLEIANKLLEKRRKQA
jgi:hypothetical protein